MVTALLLAGCGLTNPSASIQADIDRNPSAKASGLVVTVKAFKDGYVTLSVGGLDARSASSLKKDGDPGLVAWCCDSRIAKLAGVSEVIKKRSEVKGIVWTADSP